MAQNKPEETPMMRQFYSLKEKHPDAVLLFRCGDFYETYAQDAVEASEILGITLTRRNNGKNGAMALEMAGFPHHALDVYLPKLIRAGRRVAICDQLEDPKLTKTLVKRGITELVTPGVAMSDNVLQNKENNFLAAVHFGKGAWGISFLDISTGEYLIAEGPADHIDKLLSNFAPKETLIERGRRQQFEQSFGPRYCLRELDDWVFTEEFAREKLNRHFKVRNLKGFGVDHLRNGKVAAGAILEYLAETLHNNIGHISSIRLIDEERYVRLDKFTVRNLTMKTVCHCSRLLTIPLHPWVPACCAVGCFSRLRIPLQLTTVSMWLTICSVIPILPMRLRIHFNAWVIWSVWFQRQLWAALIRVKCSH